ncbi:putative Radial spoke head 1-like protein [Hypsibius exemplaris]|uniref:Radial spoke head 1-like protein n=1 Tax=Hypsibius exemplaris TaxID=2072580 RepID=A0A1W0WCY7_HYPEX|nr:putative Radial spoke head 1-like protein [Hypsibius exemplaris]
MHMARFSLRIVQLNVVGSVDELKRGYEHSRRNNHGVYLFKSGARYEGAWKDGVKHGPGKFLYPDGSSYEGYFVKDNKQGYGVYEFENGDMYAGEWKTGLRHGYGVYKYKESGAKFSGFWANDKRTGKGEVLCGSYKYVGTYLDDQPTEPGKFVFLGGYEQHGHFAPVLMDPSLAAMTVDTPVEEQGSETEEGSQVSVMKWIAEKLIFPDVIDPSVDPTELAKRKATTG